MQNHTFSKQVILGNGSFPSHTIPLSILQQAQTIICCDGAAQSLLERGIEPTLIIGDLDSISAPAKQHFAHKILHIADQYTNDQTKAVEWAIQQGFTDAVILGSTGLREDHTIGNISLLAQYGTRMSICSVTNFGVFTPMYGTQSFESYIGQVVSIFSLTPHIPLTFKGLQYPITNAMLHSWWMGTLNTAIDNTFTIESNGGECIVFQEF